MLVILIYVSPVALTHHVLKSNYNTKEHELNKIH